MRRSLPLSAQVLLEIPSAPLAAANSLPKAARNLRAERMRVTHADGYHLVGLKFSHPLVSHSLPSLPVHEKLLLHCENIFPTPSIVFEAKWTGRPITRSGHASNQVTA